MQSSLQYNSLPESLLSIIYTIRTIHPKCRTDITLTSSIYINLYKVVLLSIEKETQRQRERYCALSVAVKPITTVTVAHIVVVIIVVGH